MIGNYQNFDSEIASALQPTTGEWINSEDKNLLQGAILNTNFGTDERDYVELHVYDLGGRKPGRWITGNHKIDKWSINPPQKYPDRKTKKIFLSIDANMRQLGLNRGQFKIAYNFFRQHVGGYQKPSNLFIKDISTSRNEILIGRTNLKDFRLRKELRQWLDRYSGVADLKEYITYDPGATTWKLSIEEKAEQNGLTYNEQLDIDVRFEISKNPDKYKSGGKYFPTYAINLGRNQVYHIINVAELDTGDVAIKLYEPLPEDIKVKQVMWVVSQVRRSHIDNIRMIPRSVATPTNTLRGPNFDLIDNSYSNITETEFESWNELLGSNLSTSQQLIDTYFSGSLSGIKLNIDFCEFDNFIHFSSAEERVKNFFYKLQLLDSYDSRLGVLLSATGSVDQNVIDTTRKRNEIISGFDDFEKYLYFESGSGRYSYVESCSIEPYPKEQNVEVTPLTWAEAYTLWVQSNFTFSDGSIVTSSPAYRPYSLYPYTSSIAESYRFDLLEKAKLYDKLNESALVKTIPEHIRLAPENESYCLFTQMMGHHFDILWLYIKSLTDIHTREEHPDDGMSNELLYEVAKSMGWTLSNGKQSKTLWEYALGTDEEGDMHTSGSEMQSKTGASYTHEVWRRIVNNLPHLLKTKGTARSVRAIASAYGVPQTVLTIREYGGPAVFTEAPEFIKEQFDYALNMFDGVHLQTRWEEIPYTGSARFPDTITLRFKTHLDKAEFNYNNYTPHTLMQVGDGPTPSMYVELERSGSIRKQGNVNFYILGSTGYHTASIQDVCIFDDDFTTIMLRRLNSDDDPTVDNRYDFFVKKHKYGKLTINASASFEVSGTLGALSQSFNSAWTTQANMYVGGYSNNPSSGSLGFTGSLQEFRYWMTPLSESIFDNHVTSPTSYNGNHATSSYNDLAFRIALLDKFNANSTQSLDSAHPNQNNDTFFSGAPLTASLVGAWPNDMDEDQWISRQEIHYIETPSIGANNIYSDKIRIENNYVDQPLSVKARVEKSSYDTAPVDSPRLGVYFSPQSVINDDIFKQFGYIELDDYIGDPANIYKSDYPALETISYEYWKKYSNKNDVAAYLRLFSLFDFSMFKQIQQLLPARSNAVTGLLVEPTILERSKVASLPPTIEELYWESNALSGSFPLEGEVKQLEATVTASNPIEGDFFYEEGVIQTPADAITGSALETPEQLNPITRKEDIEGFVSHSLESQGLIQMLATSGEGSRYCFDNLVPSASAWTTQSNPYWECAAVQPSVTASRPSINRTTIGFSDYYETAWHAPTTASSLSSSTVPWTDTDNATGSPDGLYAIAESTTAEDDTYKLVLTEYDFGESVIPDGAIITGVVARVHRKASHQDLTSGSEAYVYDKSITLGLNNDATEESLNLSSSAAAFSSSLQVVVHEIAVTGSWVDRANVGIGISQTASPTSGSEVTGSNLIGLYGGNTGSFASWTLPTTPSSADSLRTNVSFWPSFATSPITGSASIKGLGVRFYWSQANADTIGDNVTLKHLHFNKQFSTASDPFNGDDKGDGTSLPTTPGWSNEYGGSDDLWGQSNWIPNDFSVTSSIQFQLSLNEAGFFTGSNIEGRVHGVQMRVYYTYPSYSIQEVLTPIPTSYSALGEKKIYGASNNTWGLSLTPQDIASGSLSLKIQSNIVDTPGGGVEAQIDTAELKVYYKLSQSSSIAEVQDYVPLGVKNHRYLGCKLSATDFNENSSDTIDGGPVIEITTVNPRTLVSQPRDASRGGFNLGNNR